MNEYNTWEPYQVEVSFFLGIVFRIANNTENKEASLTQVGPDLLFLTIEKQAQYEKHKGKIKDPGHQGHEA